MGITGIRMALVLMLICAFPSFSEGQDKTGLEGRVYETILSNGLKVILLENHKAPVATFQVWYRVGSRNEAWGKTGISHVLEHMMFTGTKGVRGETFTRVIEETGGNNNAFTSADYTAYFENMTANEISVAIDLEADRMQGLLLRQDRFETEQMVVMEERRLRTEDDPQAYLYEQLRATAFQTQPYHWPVIGWMKDLKRLTLDDLRAHYRTYYSPANAVVILAGDVRKEEMLPRIEKAFGSIAAGCRADQEKSQEEAQTGERRIVVKRQAQLPFVLMGYHVPNLRSPDGYVLEVIAAILAQGKSSRLHERLVRKGLALTADADNDLLSRDPGLFLVSAQPSPGMDTVEVERAIDDEIQRLHREPISGEELEKAKNQLEAAFILGQDSLFYQAMVLAQHEIASDWRAVDSYVPSIRSVTQEDIVRVTKQYLITDNRTAAVLIPTPPKEAQGEKDSGR